MKWHRNSIGVEIDREYCRQTARRLLQENSDLFSQADVQFLKEFPGAGRDASQVCEDASLYGIKRAVKAKYSGLIELGYRLMHFHWQRQIKNR
jgi:hypothetical protein